MIDFVKQVFKADAPSDVKAIRFMFLIGAVILASELSMLGYLFVRHYAR